MSKPVSIQEFMQMFPDDDACLEYLFKARYGAVLRVRFVA